MTNVPWSTEFKYNWVINFLNDERLCELSKYAHLSFTYAPRWSKLMETEDSLPFKATGMKCLFILILCCCTSDGWTKWSHQHASNGVQDENIPDWIRKPYGLKPEYHIVRPTNYLKIRWDWVSLHRVDRNKTQLNNKLNAHEDKDIFDMWPLFAYCLQYVCWACIVSPAVHSSDGYMRFKAYIVSHLVVHLSHLIQLMSLLFSTSLCLKKNIEH